MPYVKSHWWNDCVQHSQGMLFEGIQGILNYPTSLLTSSLHYPYLSHETIRFDSKHYLIYFKPINYCKVVHIIKSSTVLAVSEARSWLCPPYITHTAHRFQSLAGVHSGHHTIGNHVVAALVDLYCGDLRGLWTAGSGGWTQRVSLHV